MLNTLLYSKYLSKLLIQPVKNIEPDIVDVNPSNTEIKGYIDVRLQLAAVKIAHPLLVVTDLSFPILLGTDILPAHLATMSLKDAVPL